MLATPRKLTLERKTDWPHMAARISVIPEMFLYLSTVAGIIYVPLSSEARKWVFEFTGLQHKIPAKSSLQTHTLGFVLYYSCCLRSLGAILALCFLKIKT